MTGLWLSAPSLQESWAVVSVISSTVTFSGGPGEPEAGKGANAGGYSPNVTLIHQREGRVT